jgi:hypothetical protein
MAVKCVKTEITTKNTVIRSKIRAIIKKVILSNLVNIPILHSNPTPSALARA